MRVDVIVVGGGIAGLAAAYELSRRNKTVCVLEATERFGGRMRSWRKPGLQVVVELGAEFIGSNHKRWVAYAKEFGILLEPAEWTPLQWLELGGRRIEGRELEELNDQCAELQNQLTEFAKPIDDERPWLTPGAAELDSLSLHDGFMSRLSGSDLAKRRLLMAFSQSEAADPRRISWLGQLTAIKGHGLERYWEETEAFRCAGGVSQLAQGFVSRIPRASLHASSPLASLRIDAGSAIAVTHDGSIHEGDAVVLAVPPSQWPKIKIDPPLPEGLSLDVGAASKEFVEISQAHWPADRFPHVAAETPRGSLSFRQGGGRPFPELLTWYVASEPARELPKMADHDRKIRLFQVIGAPLSNGATSDGEWFAQDWVCEPYVEGAYSCAQIGRISRWGEFLYQGRGPLAFAGEHASFRYPGYMEGALETAQRAVDRIMRR